MKLLIDMNLSPAGREYLAGADIDATIGRANATDAETMQWARENDRVVFTHDLDFGILLAHSRSGRPSVIQVRAQDVSPAHLGPLVVAALREHQAMLERGALVTVDETRSRVRILPI